jgi:hypothetical protein
MGTWKYDQPPTWRKDAVATDGGWAHPKTGEILAACRQLILRRREKLDESSLNLRTESDGLFMLEQSNPDTTNNYLLLDE